MAVTKEKLSSILNKQYFTAKPKRNKDDLVDIGSDSTAANVDSYFIPAITQQKTSFRSYDWKYPLRVASSNRTCSSNVRELLPDIQPKLKISEPGDAYEQEADKIAEYIVTTAAPLHDKRLLPSSKSDEISFVSRRCQSCDLSEQRDEEQLTANLRNIVRREGSDNSPSHAVDYLLHSSGSPLDESTRSFMEPRMGFDFSNVRVHTNEKAARSAESIDALAYTVGNNIIFGFGQYSPNSREGKRLLAHELSHVLQQDKSNDFFGNMSLKNTSSREDFRDLRGISTASSKIYRQAKTRHGTPGTSFLIDVPGETISSEDGKYSGTVKRERYESKEAFLKGKAALDVGLVKLEYNEKSCEIVLPIKVQFTNDKDPKAPLKDVPLKENTFRELSRKYVEVVNTMLNGWYSITVNKCSGDGPKCVGRSIPIRVKMTESETNPDYKVIFSSRPGGARSGVRLRSTETEVPRATFYEKEMDPYTMAHEAVHMALQFGDEYVEEDPSRKRYVHLETVNEVDWSLAANQHAFGRWSLLHERHFNFAKTFMEKVLENKGHPECAVRLQEISRPRQLVLSMSLTPLGYTKYIGGTSSLYYGLGLDVGVPLNRLREWQLLLGAHGTLLLDLSGKNRQGFLLGARAGLERLWTPSVGGFRLGGFAEAGTGLSGALTGKAYGELGTSVGYAGPPSPAMTFALETAFGTGLNLNDPEIQRWYRIGLSVGFKF